MKRQAIHVLIIPVLLTCVLTGCQTARVTSPEITESIEIRVNPGMLNLQNQGQVVTIYTSLAYKDVVRTTVTLNGLSLGCWGTNKEGSYAAKFSDSTVKALYLPPGAGGYTLTLSGEKKDGTRFTGSSAITIVNNASENQK